MKDRVLNILFATPYTLTEQSLEKLCTKLASQLNCSIKEIKIQFDENKGYYFYGPYNICIADLLFEGNEYRGIQIYSENVEDLKKQLEEERRRIEEENALKEQRTKKRKFVLQKYVVPGIAFTMIGIATLTGIGAINKALANEQTETVQETRNLNTIVSANDLILYAWADYAMSELDSIAKESESEKAYIESLRTKYQAPIISAYDDYKEEKELSLPIEITGESIKNNHNAFRNRAYLFDKELQESNYKGYSFANSPYSKAILVDNDDNIIAMSNNGLFGEVYTFNGELVTLENKMGYRIYIRAQDVIGNDYGTSNYPEDAIMKDGIVYVDSSHLHDFKAPSMGSK